MSGKCPHCGEELEYIHEIQQVEVCYDVRIDENHSAEDFNDVEYEKHDDYDTAADWGVAECPQCSEIIQEISDEEDAVNFLKGKLEVKS